MSLVDGLEKSPIGWVKKGSTALAEFVTEYEHKGSKWSVELFADDLEDALAKIESIKASLKLLGVLDSRIPFDPSIPAAQPDPSPSL